MSDVAKEGGSAAVVESKPPQPGSQPDAQHCRPDKRGRGGCWWPWCGGLTFVQCTEDTILFSQEEIPHTLVPVCTAHMRKVLRR
jgi:hypothetical protein